MRYNYNTPATIKRLGAYSSGKSTKADVAGTIFGQFRPISKVGQYGADRVSGMGVVGQSFIFITDGRKDIRTTDQLTINAENYNVKGVARYKQMSQDVLSIMLEKSVNLAG